MTIEAAAGLVDVVKGKSTIPGTSSVVVTSLVEGQLLVS
jgi:hypothetical protein